MRLDVELTRACDADDLVRSLVASGLEAGPAAQPGHVTVSADDLALLQHAIDEWTAERGLPFVPYLVDGRVVVAPPAS